MPQQKPVIFTGNPFFISVGKIAQEKWAKAYPVWYSFISLQKNTHT
jgi:hypothetical protein